MRPIASLSPGLLARKGDARPAMRGPALDGPDQVARQEPMPGELPAVLLERAALTDGVAGLVADTAGSSRTGKAAFTLRLIAERHLRLRLASAVTRRSAQAIVTDALDAFLSTLPEVEELARRCSSTAEPTADLGNRP